MILSLIPNLMARDVSLSVNFYSRCLGFEVLQRAPAEGPSIWALLRRRSALVMLQSGPSLVGEFEELGAQPGGGSLTLFIQVEDPATLFDSVKNCAAVIKPLGITSYNGALEFVLRDPDGFILHFSNFDLGVRRGPDADFR